MWACLVPLMLVGPGDRAVAELNEPSYPVRRAAERTLVEMGEAARPALERGVASGDVHVARASRRLLDGLRRRLAERPTLVTLRLDGVEAKLAARRLAEAAGVGIDDEVCEHYEPTPVTLDVTDRPFWEVLGELERQGGLRLDVELDADGPRIDLSAHGLEPDGRAAGPFPSARAGPFRVEFRQVVEQARRQGPAAAEVAAVPAEPGRSLRAVVLLDPNREAARRAAAGADRRPARVGPLRLEVDRYETDAGPLPPPAGSGDDAARYGSLHGGDGGLRQEQTVRLPEAGPLAMPTRLTGAVVETLPAEERTLTLEPATRGSADVTISGTLLKLEAWERDEAGDEEDAADADADGNLWRGRLIVGNPGELSSQPAFWRRVTVTGDDGTATPAEVRDWDWERGGYVVELGAELPAGTWPARVTFRFPTSLREERHTFVLELGDGAEAGR